MLIAVGLLGAVSLGWHLRPQPAAPTDEQWRAAGVWLESRLTDGDVLRVRPAWMVQAETLLRSVSADKHPFIDRSKTASRMLGAQYKRLWQLSAMGYSAGPPPTGATEISRFDLDGGIEVILYRLDRDRIRFPLAAHLRDAVVSRRRGPDDAYTACRRRNDWHDCRGKAWENVRTQLHHVAERRVNVSHYTHILTMVAWIAGCLHR